jgi:glutathione S-transferase
MKLYTSGWAPNGRRVAMFLAEKQIEVPTVEVDLEKRENRADGFLARNPLGRVPVLELDDGSHLTESVAISRYFEALHPTPSLFGTTPLEQATIEMWNRRAELNVLMPIAQAFRSLTPIFKQFEKVVPEWGPVAEEQARDALPIFDDQLARHTYLAGEQFSIADITLALTLSFARSTQRQLPYDLPNLSRWYAAVTARPSYPRRAS